MLYFVWITDGEPIECENGFNSDGEVDEDDNWDEMEMEKEPTKCLFCDEVGSSIETAIEHLDQQHHISLSAIKRKFHLDQYSYIKVDFWIFFCQIFGFFCSIFFQSQILMFSNFFIRINPSR